MGSAPRSRPAWLVSPAVDLTVGCGAWSLPLLVAAFAFEPEARPWGLGFYTLGLLVNQPHYMATIRRAYGTGTDFTRYRRAALDLTVVLGIALVAAHRFYGLVPWLVTIALTWSPWHYASQNFGLAMLWTQRNEATVRPGERRALRAAFAISAVLLVASVHGSPSEDPYFRAWDEPRLRLLALPLGGAAIALASVALGTLARRVGWRTILPSAVIVSSQLLWFVVPAVLEATTDLPSSRLFSVGTLAVLHGCQYLWITTAFAAREAKRAGRVAWRFRTHFAMLVVGGAALLVPGPWIASRLLGVDFAVSALAFFAIVNLHHFVLDAAIWRSRDERVRSLLFDPDAEPALPSADTPAAPSWRLAGATAVAALALLTALDQWRYYLVNGERTVGKLAVAAAMTPDDSIVQMRLARAYAEAGDAEGRARALERAIEISARGLGAPSR